MNNNLQFGKFLKSLETQEFETNTTATGAVTIQQSLRNDLRKEGVAALKHDLSLIYGEDVAVLETKEGLVLVAENEPGDFTISWELKSTIKSLDYDPFIEANNFDEENAMKQEKKIQKEAAKAAKLEALQKKREKKLAELERKKNLTE